MSSRVGSSILMIPKKSGWLIVGFIFSELIPLFLCQGRFHPSGVFPPFNSDDVTKFINSLPNICQTGECQSVVDCAGRLSFKERLQNICRIHGTEVGLCCERLSQNDVKLNQLDIESVPQKIPDCKSNLFRDTAEAQARTVDHQFPVSKLASIKNLDKSSSSFFHFNHQAPKAEAIANSKLAFEELDSIKQVTIFNGKDDLCLMSHGGDILVGKVTLNELRASCNANITCNVTDVFRHPRGICNNLVKPILGAVFTPVQRILRNNYFDGFSMPRHAKNGIQLPSARFVSSLITLRDSRINTQFTVLLMTAGQFIDHDLVHVPVHQQTGNVPLDCCSSQFGNNSLQCFPIAIPPNDFAFSPRTCINFVRSLPGPSIDCLPGPNQQLNQLTHWLDGSQIYGSTEEELEALRSNTNGLLKVNPTTGNLPPDTSNSECIQSTNCFLAGDSRVNEQLSLVAMHTLFVRQHNKVALVLLRQNPNATDDALFHLTRKIVTAQWQHIVYNEWLPTVLGPTTMQRFGLWTLRRGYSNDYRSDIDPRITNEFAAAAFRVGHTWIPGSLRTYDVHSARPTATRKLRTVFNLPSAINTPGGFDEVTFGMVVQNMEDYDNRITTEVAEHLFEMNDVGLDLIAINIQRARDHGIPGYVFYREVCDSHVIETWEDLSPLISHKNIALLKQAYSDVEDIDLFAGMLLEKSNEDSIIGSTFMCIISDQFVRLKKGDRFFYDLQGQPSSFTPDQLNEIRMFSLSRLICDNTNIIRIQPLALENANHKYNFIVNCDSRAIPETHYGFWSGVI
uniref:Isolate Cr2 peroxinectin mRNA n=1 Tax=Caligus rogercresseyi TaxID=217165 RepID=A0A0A7LYX9_CALRO|nr:peroxinectin [Caligus rogercresseyi]